jgi:hypothetical protein
LSCRGRSVRAGPIDLKKARRSSTPITTAWRRSRSGSSNTSPCSSAANKLKGPILCLVGPPGVGKTSLGKSIAKATGREFVRMSLGGVRDEAEIRGHRRTYIGSMPGKIIQSMKQGQEVQSALPARRDRQDGHGFPRRSVLGPAGGARSGAEHTFNDHYLEVDYDLSDVMFVTTANTLNIPPAADGPHGDHPHRRLHRGREGRDRPPSPDAQGDQGPRPPGRRVLDRPTRPCASLSALHPRGRCA